MLEVNNWFFVLLILFISLYFILNQILFQPMLRVFKERDAAMSGSVDEAARMREDREKVLEEFKREMGEASSRAKEVFDALREEGLTKQRELMEAAGKEAQGLIEKARAELAAAAAKASASLEADAEKYAEKIADKLLRV